MMLTDAQKKAVQSPGRNILVEAGAGSGKTRVLVERIAYLVEARGVATDEILALTFTDQATCEMKTRLSKRLGQDMQSVLTFHRFCGRLLRENPLLADVDPDFAMLDGARAKQVLREILMKLLRHSEDRELQRRLAQTGIDEMVPTVLALYEKGRNLPPSPLSLRQRTEQQVRALREQQWDVWREVVEQLVALYEENRIQAPGTRARLQAIQEAWRQLSEEVRESRVEMWDEQATLVLQTVGEAIFQQVGGNVAQEVKPLFQKLALLKKDRLWEDLVLDRTRALRGSMCALLDELDVEYKRVKQERGWCDFSDLELGAYRLLAEHEDVRQRYGAKFSHVLVDEYQDTNPVQQAILELLRVGRGAAEGSHFMVGDPRQSIYRFRGADVRGFATSRQALGAQDEWVEMRDNFRMNDSLCAWVRDICQRLFGDAEIATLTTFSTEGPLPDGQVVAELLVPNVAQAEQKHECEADLLARRILQLGRGRFGDVAILLQTRTHQAVFVKALQRYGIPVRVEEDAGFWRRQEVQDLLHLLQVLVDPEDGVALLGFLRGPLVRWPDAFLWKVAQTDGLTAGFWAATQTGLDAEEQERVLAVKAQLARWRQEVERCNVADWLYALLYGHGVEDLLGGGRLDVFIEWAQEAESIGVVNLAELLTDWRQREAAGERVIGEGTAEEDGGRGYVRVMTIHASKGLEFPVVCLPDLTHPHTLRMDVLHLCETYGLAVKWRDSTAQGWQPTLSYAAAARLEKAAEAAEKKRLFYVGITRAKEKVILSGAASAFTEKAFLEECSNWWDWLPHLLPELQEGVLEERMLTGRGWKMQVVRDEEVPRAVGRGAEGERNELVEAGRQVGRVDEPVFHEAFGVEKARERIWSVTELVKQAGTSESASGVAQRVGSRVSKSRYDELQAHEWGQIVHALLEYLRPDDTEEIIRDVRLPIALAANGFAGRERLPQIWERVRESVRRYRESELFQEYKAARVRHHEFPFVMELLPGLNVSGVIDALWVRADGKATIVDFKTMRCRTKNDKQEVVERYAPQVRIYAMAVERLLGWQVDRVGVYLTEAGEFLEVGSELGDQEEWLERMVAMGE